jgi:transcriptional regulator with XRE-family HTH domain
MHQLDKKTVARLIKEGRAAKGYTQQELSDRAGISLRSVQRIENGEVLPRLYTVRILAEQLGFSEALLPQETPAAPGQSIEKEPSPPDSPSPLSHSNSPSPLPHAKRPGKMILSIGLGIVLILGATAFIAQAPRFPETDFEGLVFWMTIAGAYTLILYRIWK